jgi:hypothetical protein
LVRRSRARREPRVVFAIGSQNVGSQRAIEKLSAIRTVSRRDAAGRESFVDTIHADGRES